MDYLRLIEEDLNSLSVELKRKYPEVKEVTDRALQSLRIIREMYVSDVMRKEATSSSNKTRKFPTSSDLTAPYILACNHTDASQKLITMALNGIHMLLNYEVVPPAEVKNILRVLTIQSANGKSEHHMKILQILLLIVNLLSADDTNFQYLNEATLCTLLSLCLQIGESKNSVSLSSTALATASQMVSVVFDEIDKILAAGLNSSIGQKSSVLIACGRNLLMDVISFSNLQNSQWLKGTFPQVNALDIVYEVLSERKHLFVEGGLYRSIFIERFLPSLKTQLRSVQDDFVAAATKYGLASGAAVSSRIIRLARCVLIDYICILLLDDCSLILTLLLHTLQPDRGDYTTPRDSSPRQIGDDVAQSPVEKATSLFSSGGSLISKLGITQSSKPQSLKTSSLPSPSLYLTLVNSGPTSLTSQSNIHFGNATHASQIASHPAGASLETFLSFFLSDFSSLIENEDGARFIANALVNTIVAVCILLSGALGSESNCKDLDQVIRGSQITTLLEGVLTGAEVDVDYVLRSVHELLISSPSIEPPELLVLGFELLQVGVRLIVKLCLHQASSNILDNEILFSISPDVLKNLPTFDHKVQCDSLHHRLRDICDNCFEAVHETCLNVLKKIESASAVRRSLGMLTELAICCGFTGSVKFCNLIITSMCKLSVPKWHGIELVTYESNSGEIDVLRWRHVQAFSRLVQTIHLLSDVINDWDTIIDAFAQLFTVMQFKSKDDKLTEDVGLIDLQKIQQCFERFKIFTLFICDEALVRLMSSLVALSMNGLGDNQRNPQSISASQQPSYMKDASQAGVVSFSFRAVIDIAKLNSYRVSSVWQMVTSHLRMVASQKSAQLRLLAVAATHDVISSALAYMMRPSIPLDGVDFVSAEILPEALTKRLTVCLSDEILFSWVMPTFETVFRPRIFHRSLLIERAISDEKSRDQNLLRLSRNDLLSSLKVISTVRYDDVKNGVLNGLLSTLQNDGHLFAGAWTPVVEILLMVPSSFEFRNNGLNSTDGSDILKDNSVSDDIHTRKWSKQALSTAFNCMKLIIDDFEDLLEVEDIKAVNECLSLFCSQSADVNISFTSIELVWKISDSTSNNLRAKNDIATAEEVFKQMMILLKNQSADSRPEIRHCAMNTLFGSIVVNGVKISSPTWKFVFNDVLFPVFDHAGVRSALAMERNEDAIAPELKKGVKMTVHHTRDTAYKQWSETQVLALKGLTRILRSCTKYLLLFDWFSTTWASIIDVCKTSLLLNQCETEVKLAGLDCLFSMLKFVSLSADSKGVSSEETKTAKFESARESLWNQSWYSLMETANVNLNSLELSHYFCQNMSSLYATCAEAEFRYSHNIQGFLALLSIVSRPRIVDISTYPRTYTPQEKAAELQLQRAIVDILRKLQTAESISLPILSTTLSEISFANQIVTVMGAYSGSNIYLGPSPLKLRQEVSQLLIHIFKGDSNDDKDMKSPMRKSFSTSGREISQDVFIQRAHFQGLDVILRQFVDEIFAHSIEKRILELGDELVSKPIAAHVIPDFRTSSTKSYFNIFTAMSKFLKTESDVDSETHRQMSHSIEGEKAMTASNIIYHAPFVVYEQNSDRSYWVPCHLPVELRLVLSVLRVTCTQIIPLHSWPNIIHLVFCIASPWRNNDLDVKDYNLSVLTPSATEESAVSIIEILKVIVERITDDSSEKPSEWVIAFIYAITSSVRLAILATFETWIDTNDESEEGASHRLAFSKYYENILEFVLHTMLTIYSCHHLSSEIQKTALKGLMMISIDLANYSLKSFKYIQYDTNYSPIMYGCEQYLQRIFSIQSTFDSDHFSLNTSIPQEKSLWIEWLHLFSFDKEKLSKSNQSVESTSSSMLHLQVIVSGNLNKHSHLLLVVPLAQKLIATYDGVQAPCAVRLKNVAKDIIDMIDVKVLTQSLIKLAEEVNSLKKENNELREEIASIKNAATLPF